jgi:hypothetical protein
LIVCVEAILNVLSLEKVDDSFVPVCVFKHSISSAQLEKMTGFPCVKEICVLYDSDSTEDAWIEAGRKLASRVKVSVAKMPVQPGKKKGDPNDNPLAAIEAIRNRRSYSITGELSSMLDGL